MQMQISVREYDYIFPISAQVENHTPVPDTVYCTLKQYTMQRSQGSAEVLRLTRYQQNECLQVQRNVGVLCLQDGSVIEFLPKITIAADSIQERKILLNMLTKVYQLPKQITGQTSLQAHLGMWLEWMYGQFLQQVQILLRGQLNGQYQRQAQLSPHLKGQWQIAKQLRQPISHRLYFMVEREHYTWDIAPLRLLKWALQQVESSSKTCYYQHSAQQLGRYLSDVPLSLQPKVDLVQWQKNYHQAHYRKLYSWLALLVQHHSAHSFLGAWRGVALLFPMERLFERYVAHCLRQQLPIGSKLIEQPQSCNLIDAHQEQAVFRLRPDFLISQAGKHIQVLDAKWKRLDTTKGTPYYALQSSDLYQLYVYGKKYLAGQGNVILLYPKWEKFQQALAPFHFDSQLTLWVLPVDLATGKITMI